MEKIQGVSYWINILPTVAPWFSSWTENFAFSSVTAVHPEPTSPAPGLSDHGQMHAIDFVVMKGHTKIADTKTATIGIQWDTPGWTQKFKGRDDDELRIQCARRREPSKLKRKPRHAWNPFTEQFWGMRKSGLSASASALGVSTEAVAAAARASAAAAKAGFPA